MVREITIARSKFLGLWYFSQSLAWANSSSFFESSFRLMSLALSSAITSPSPMLQFLGVCMERKEFLKLLKRKKGTLLYEEWYLVRAYGNKIEKNNENQCISLGLKIRFSTAATKQNGQLQCIKLIKNIRFSLSILTWLMLIFEGKRKFELTKC